MKENRSTHGLKLTSACTDNRGPVRVQRLPIKFVSDDSRIISLPFIPNGANRVQSLLDRMANLSEDDVDKTLEQVQNDYGHRHKNILSLFDEHYRAAANLGYVPEGWSENRELLAGAFMTMEYAIESAALFNPSIVIHPDQSGVSNGSVRFILSLRATGEGHISSIVFRTGTIEADDGINLDPAPKILQRSRIKQDRYYLRFLFGRKLHEMAVNGRAVEVVLNALPEEFTLNHLYEVVQNTADQYRDIPNSQQTVEAMLWLARSNYHVELSRDTDISELVIFPMSKEEEHGVEDLRLVRFVEDDGQATYFGTYTAYSGQSTLPMIIATKDFREIEIHSLNGACARNKGMALFPRRVNGHYAMCSRIDGENLYIMYSDYTHFWESAERLHVPNLPWELMQIGNCGSPLETEAGWLLLTHGVGPMRTYCIGAMLLDINDPLRIIGYLKEPLISPLHDEREGYVPNVTYTCGAIIHNNQLFIPYAVADKYASVAVVELDELIGRLLDNGGG